MPSLPRWLGGWRRRTIIFALGGFLLLLVVLVLLAVPLMKVRGDATAAQHDLTAAKAALQDGDLASARASVRSARQHVDSAQDAVHGLGGDVWGRIPGAGAPISDARHLVMSYLDVRGMPPALVADAALATSELVTNALVHGRPPIELRLRLEGTEVLVEVRDRATYQPRKLRPDETDEHGRGLQIVAAISTRWGTRPTEHGKAVWCVLDTQV